MEFMEKISYKIAHYSSENNFDDKEFLECDFELKKLENDYLRTNSEKEKINLLSKIEELKSKRDSIVIRIGDFFPKYMSNFCSFLQTLKDNYLKDLSKKKFNKKEEQDTFEYFMFFISNYDFEEMPDFMYLVWKYSFQDLT